MKKKLLIMVLIRKHLLEISSKGLNMTDEELYQELIDEWDSLSEEINSSWDKLQAEVPYDIFNEIKEWVNYECNQFGTSYEGLVDKTQVTGDAQLSEFSFCKYEYVDQYCGYTGDDFHGSLYLPFKDKFIKICYSM